MNWSRNNKLKLYEMFCDKAHDYFMSHLEISREEYNRWWDEFLESFGIERIRYSNEEEEHLNGKGFAYKGEEDDNRPHGRPNYFWAENDSLIMWDHNMGGGLRIKKDLAEKFLVLGLP